MSPSDTLRTLLDKLGVEHYDHENGEPLRDLSEAGADPATSWRMGGANVCAVPNKYGTFDLWIDNCTPEQAIAATCEPWNTRSDYAVQAANERKVDERDTVPVTKYQMALDDARKSNMDAERWERIARDHQSKCESLKQTNADLRRIIDEMRAATVGAGTCKAIDTGYATARCSECGTEFMGSIMTNEPPDYVKPLERCPRCGKRIIEEVTE